VHRTARDNASAVRADIISDRQRSDHHGEARVADTSGNLIRTNDFLLRRLHSLSGIIPLGAFLFMHLLTNFMVVVNTAEHDYYQEKVDIIHFFGPLTTLVEVFGILLPLAFHAGLGVLIWLEGKSNVRQYPYSGSVRYMLQRVTGVVAMVFILAHLWHMHWVGKPLGGGYFDPDRATRTAAAAIQMNVAVTIPLYAVGILAVCYHFANGIWTFLITWGVTIGPVVQRKVGYACAGLGILLALMGLASLRTFVTLTPEDLPRDAAVRLEEERATPATGEEGLYDS
jgi:succinate dehydrogenase / fumarate reductase cytochrome b subunit